MKPWSCVELYLGGVDAGWCVDGVDIEQGEDVEGVHPLLLDAVVLVGCADPLEAGGGLLARPCPPV